MKIFLLFLLLAPAASADEWTKADTTRESAYTVLHIIDWQQTRFISKNPAWHEQNIMLGEHPHVDKVDAYFLATSIGHYAISRALPREYRDAWQYVTIGVEVGAMAHNYSIGVRVGF